MFLSAGVVLRNFSFEEVEEILIAIGRWFAILINLIKVLIHFWTITGLQSMGFYIKFFFFKIRRKYFKIFIIHQEGTLYMFNKNRLYVNSLFWSFPDLRFKDIFIVRAEEKAEENLSMPRHDILQY